jgi:hypothetical protein
VGAGERRGGEGEASGCHATGRQRAEIAGQALAPCPLPSCHPAAPGAAHMGMAEYTMRKPLSRHSMMMNVASRPPATSLRLLGVGEG